ncbi:hypothetical protein IQ15_07761 [Bradyrhizobium yuanmingense]|nr:hypothetical protein IQ15_07761 [Bradyrhizobium yuanmingense]
MTRDITPAGWPATGAVDEAFAEVRASFDRFCLAAGIEALGTMMEADVTAACGPRHGRDAERRAHRWGRTRGRIGLHGGKIEVERPSVRGVDGREVTIPSWETAAGDEPDTDQCVDAPVRPRCPAAEGDVPAAPGSGVSKSAASRRFVALSAARLADFMAADLSALDLLVIQIDGLHLDDDLVLVAVIGVDGEGNKHPLALVEGTTDGDGRNSPFTTALLRHIETPGLEISFLFRRVRDDVMTATKREQQPFVYGSLSKEEIFLKGRIVSLPNAPGSSAPASSIAPATIVSTPSSDTNASKEAARSDGQHLIAVN